MNLSINDSYIFSKCEQITDLHIEMENCTLDDNQ